MQIRGGSKSRINGKIELLKLELSKPKEEQNKEKIKRLKESIKRNKNISKLICKKRRWKKQKRI